jgi:O-6-methylguanine DNA methyltransferase
MILNKACFKTKIGMLYYLWLDNAGNPLVAALTTNKGWLDDYISILKDENNSLSIKDRSFSLIETAINTYLDEGREISGLRPIFLSGTGFEQSVWREAARVPYGCTCSYGDLAAMCGRPGAGRAVGNAMGKNPVLLIVPCHRIIKGDGSLGGFGSGPGLKKRLLALEGIKF